VHTRSSNYKGYVRDATKNDHQYDIESDKADHIAMHEKVVPKRREGKARIASQLILSLKLLYRETHNEFPRRID